MFNFSTMSGRKTFLFISTILTVKQFLKKCKTQKMISKKLFGDIKRIKILLLDVSSRRMLNVSVGKIVVIVL